MPRVNGLKFHRNALRRLKTGDKNLDYVEMKTHIILPLGTSLIDWLSGEILDCAENRHDLSSLAVVFPGKRPGIYLRHALAKRLKRPFHPPHIFDIDSFMKWICSQGINGRDRRDSTLINSLYLLFKMMKEVSADTSLKHISALLKNFEDFFYWGLELLETFELLGTELVPPERLKAVVQTALLEAGLEDKARGIWPILPQLYEEWQTRLEDEALWTRGEIYYHAAKLAEKADITFDKIYLCGFFALTESEKKVFHFLTEKEKAKVVVQADERLIGHEIYSPLKDLMSSCSGRWSHDPKKNVNRDNGTEKKGEICLYQSVDLHCQIEMAKSALKTSIRGNRIQPEEMALVLPDTTSLIPILTHLVSDFEVPYNISMGYPSDRAPITHLLFYLLDAVDGREEGKYYAHHYLQVLRHPYIKNIKSEMEQIPPDDEKALRYIIGLIEKWIDEERKLYFSLDEIESKISVSACEITGRQFEILREIHEMGFRALEQASRIGEYSLSLMKFLEYISKSSSAAQYAFFDDFFRAVMKVLEELVSDAISGEAISSSGFRLLFRHIMRQNRIPFQGIPLEGLQILGLLETRSLNFKKVAIFDVNEGVIPSERKIDPILTADIRKYLNLPDQRSVVAIQRYNFRRLLAGAEEIHLFFREGDGKIRSRFIEELVWEAEKEKRKRGVIPLEQPVQTFPPLVHKPCQVEKNNEVLSFLSGFSLSATSIDTYMKCPLRFYYRYVLGLDSPKILNADVIDPLMVGNLVHEILYEIYLPRLNKELDRKFFSNIDLESAVDRVLTKTLGEKAEWAASIELFREVLLFRIGHFLRLDEKMSSGHMLLGIELPIRRRIILDDGKKVLVRGTIDRIEKDLDNRIWVLDYKTGSRLSIPKVENETCLTDRIAIKEEIISFQLPLYLLLCDKHFGLGNCWDMMNGALLRLMGLTSSTREKDLRKELFRKGASPTALMNNVFLPALKALLSEIYSRDIPFSADPSDSHYCTTCDYSAGLCQAS